MAKKKEHIDINILLEQELSKLQRQYRILEGDKVAYSGEAGGKLKQQKKVIQILRRERLDILKDINIATSDTKCKVDNKLNDELERQMREYECLYEDLKISKTHLKEISLQVKKVEKEVDSIKPKTITDIQSQQRILKGQKAVAKLENKLETNIKKFNQVVAENSILRKEIDHMLIERAHFNALWDKIIHCLNIGKKFMLDLIEQATLAYDQREEWCNKLQALRTKGNQDLLSHSKQMRFLQRKLDHDAKLQQFLGVKGQKRILFDLEMKNKRRRKKSKKALQETLENYNNILKSIQTFCKEKDLKKLEIQFQKQEEENFALFNYINELNHETENLSYSLTDYKKKIDEQRKINEAREKEQTDEINDLKKQLLDAHDSANEITDLLDNFEDLLDVVYDGIDEMFQSLRCDDAPIALLLGDPDDMNQYNVHLFLGIIEKRLIELLHILHFKENQETIPLRLSTKVKARQKQKNLPPAPAKYIQPDKKTRYVKNALEILVPSQPCPLCVEQEQVSDVIDTLQFARTLEEVIDKLQARLLLPHALDRLHNVSACHLPQSRKIIQMRYQ